MLNGYCLVCSDVNKFRGELFHLQNILRRLEIISDKAESLLDDRVVIDDDVKTEVLRGVYYDTHSVHMMCGVCHKINSQDMKNVDKNVHNILVKICCILKNPTLKKEDVKKIKYQTLECLRGYYSICYRFIECYLCS